MGRIHGRNGMVYMSILSTGAAQPLAFVSDWTMNFTVAKVDVTALGDTNLVWVAGLPDASGDFTGFMDTATSQTYQSAVDGQPRNFYLYPTLVAVNGGPGNSTVSPGQYFYGTILPDFSVSGGVAAAVTMKSTWNAASTVARYPANGVPGT
ncbi:MAG TPA: hypothetical protein VGG75_14190 [Trebonia sp.]|jgi:hypothetical protein